MAFYSDASNSLDLWIATLDGQLQPLTQDPDPSSEREPAWSPNGSKIAFTSNKAGNLDIWVVDPDGSNPVQLTTDPADEEEPTWSPDGSRIVYIKDERGLDVIRTMNSDGTNLQRIPNVLGRLSHASFSPDGNHLVFSAAVNTAFNLMTIDADGENLDRLTTEPDVRDVDPEWGPGGIVFMSNRGGTNNLWRIQPDGSGLEMIPNTTHGGRPTWAPDGNSIAFSRGDPNGATSNIYAVDLITGVVEPLTQIRGFLEGIDIVPGTEPNTINIGSAGTVAVALLGSSRFDPVNEVNQATLTFGRTGDEASFQSCDASGVDVNQDALLDLICHFNVQETGFLFNDTQGILRCRTVDNFLIEGRDAVAIAE